MRDQATSLGRRQQLRPGCADVGRWLDAGEETWSNDSPALDGGRYSGRMVLPYSCARMVLLRPAAPTPRFLPENPALLLAFVAHPYVVGHTLPRQALSDEPHRDGLGRVYTGDGVDLNPGVGLTAGHCGRQFVRWEAFAGIDVRPFGDILSKPTVVPVGL